MNHTFLRRAILAGLVVGAFTTPLASSAQDMQDAVVADLVVVAPANGPAWWKVSKGDASVWILGLPPSSISKGVRWNQSTLRRRLKGASLMLGVYLERSGFADNVNPPLPTREMEAEVSALSARLGHRLAHTATAVDAMGLRPMYRRRHEVCLCVLEDIEATARRAGVPVVTPPAYSHFWHEQAFAVDDPQVNRCLRAVISEASTPPDQYRETAKLWAKGNVVGMLAAAPRTIGKDCAYLWPGYMERTIAFQTSVIAQALDRPGKVVAVAVIDQLVAQDGILERLREQGFTVADPSRPLED